jgi:hypothetical protein
MNSVVVHDWSPLRGRSCKLPTLQLTQLYGDLEDISGWPLNTTRHDLVVAWSSQSGTTIAWYPLSGSFPVTCGGEIEVFLTHSFRSVLANPASTQVMAVFTHDCYKYEEELTGAAENVGSVHVYDSRSYERVIQIDFQGSVERDFEICELAEGDGRRRGRGSVKSASEIIVPKPLVSDPTVMSDGTILIGMPGGDLIRVDLVKGRSEVLVGGKAPVTAVECGSDIFCVGCQDGTVTVQTQPVEGVAK